MQATKNDKKAPILLWITAAIWGFAFVAQRAGMEFLGPFTFNGIRFMLGTLSLLPLLYFQRRREQSRKVPLQSLTGGIAAGVVLFIAASLQQAGMIWTSAGKAGFITGLYVVLVPLIGIFLGQLLHKLTWTGVLISITGLFLLTVNEKFSVSKGDLLVLGSAFFWAAHVQLINHFVARIEPLLLSVIQFSVCAILSLIVAVMFETVGYGDIRDAAIPLLYAGLMSVGVAYTLQVFAQKHVHPTYASIILSFETVFAALGGWIMLHETMPIRGIAGCLLMFFGMWLVQKKNTAR